jgi:hypothetical protein
MRDEIIAGVVATVIGGILLALPVGRWWSAAKKRRKQARLAAARLIAGQQHETAAKPAREPWIRPRKGWLRRR